MITFQILGRKKLLIFKFKKEREGIKQLTDTNKLTKVCGVNQRNKY